MHLHLHSYYSFMAGTLSVKRCVELAARRNMPFLALTDTNNLSGAVEFYQEARKAGVKPVLGVELRTEREQAVLLARDVEGYREISALVTRFCEDFPAARPVLREEGEGGSGAGWEARRFPGKTGNTGSLGGCVAGLSSRVIILSSSPTVLEALLREGRTWDVYVELVHARREQWRRLKPFIRDRRLPPVATNDVYFGHPKGRLLHRALRAMGTNTTLGTLPETEVAEPGQYFCGKEEFETWFDQAPEAVENIHRIAGMCNVEFELFTPKFVSYRAPKNTDKYFLFRTLAEEGFRRRYPRPTRAHRERFEKEYGLITRLDFVDYYLVAWDVVRYAKSRNFPYVGRGSGANSIVAYCLGITNVDPIELNLFFERFLNPERRTPPDFDIDFSWRNRDEVIDYLLEKYGRDRTAMICTIPRFNSRGAIREVGKALGFSEKEIKIVTARLPHWGRAPLLEITRRLPECRDLDIETPYMRQWLRVADRLLDFPTHYGIHSGGVILAPELLSHFTPTQASAKGVRITQQDMYTLDDWGLVKLDILSTRGLGVFEDTMRQL